MRVSGGDLCIYAEAPTEPAGETLSALLTEGIKEYKQEYFMLTYNVPRDIKLLLQSLRQRNALPPPFTQRRLIRFD